MKRHYILLVIAACGLTGCNLAPTYQKPVAPTQTHYKESGRWLPATPSVAALQRGPWWRLYHDPVLNKLEDRVTLANQDIKAAVARFDEARAELAVARSALYPTVLGIANAFRAQDSGNVANKVTTPLFNDELLSVNFNYEVDLWGRVRNTVAAAGSLAAASKADLAAVQLRLHADLATYYFTLRGADNAQAVLDETVRADQKALTLVKHRYQGGADPISNLDDAQRQLETARTLATDNRLQRAQLEHAIAVLIGEAPANFTLPKRRSRIKVVHVSPQLPSTLLEQRPDVAEAEFKVQAANAQIGVARAAFFPAFNLSGGFGVESQSLVNLLRSPSIVWSLGPTTAAALLNDGAMPLLTQTIFDGGKIRALSDRARARYEETAANYRQTVLQAFQEVEDSLVALHRLQQEDRTQQAAAHAAERALHQALYRYQGGLTTYLNVVVEENAALESELAAVNVRTRQLVASVQLIKALGGGWQGDTPKSDPSPRPHSALCQR